MLSYFLSDIILFNKSYYIILSNSYISNITLVNENKNSSVNTGPNPSPKNKFLENYDFFLPE